LHEDLTRVVIGRAYHAHNRLGCGFLENVYLGALQHELLGAGIRVAREAPIAVEYDGVVIGSYRVDLLIEGVLIVGAKAEAALSPVHERQIRNYLLASRVELALLFNFGSKAEFRRFIHTNDRKRLLQSSAALSAESAVHPR
jgi:GxxExxY protein